MQWMTSVRSINSGEGDDLKILPSRGENRHIQIQLVHQFLHWVSQSLILQDLSRYILLVYERRAFRRRLMISPASVLHPFITDSLVGSPINSISAAFDNAINKMVAPPSHRRLMPTAGTLEELIKLH